MGKKLKQILQEVWGYSDFRPFQEEIMQAVVDRQDVMAILPTGAGKSLCYQLPALVLGGTCLVISPLIALMQDQVEQLLKRNIPSACLHSGLGAGMSRDIIRHAEVGRFKLLYVAPERLTSEDFLNLLSVMDIRMVAVDEAHCIAQWGHDFRPAYLQIAQIKPYLPSKIPWMALTATATLQVEQEIINSLQLKQPKRIRQSIYRKDLSYKVLQVENKATRIVELFRENPGVGILYLNSRKKTILMRQWLQSNGLKALAYHAGLPKTQREEIQKQWTLSNDTIICATSAFGMGIDKDNVRLVLHYAPPESLEAYYQEAGRAGRDGQAAQSILMYDAYDVQLLRERPGHRFPPRRYVHQVYQALADFLEIGAGAGFNQSYIFDFEQFIRNFNLKAAPTMGAIKLLEQEGYWHWEEHLRKGATIMVLANRREINQLERMKPWLAEVLTAILRLHDHVFYYPANFKIWDMAKYLNCEQSEIMAAIKELEIFGCLEYKGGQEGNFIHLLEARRAAGHLTFDVARVKRLKKAYLDRIEAMVYYLNNQDDCRNQLFADYFGEKDLHACGQCDHCLKKRKPGMPAHTLREKICLFLKDTPENSLQDLSSHFPDVSNEELIQEMRYLQEIGFCQVQFNGSILLT